MNTKQMVWLGAVAAILCGAAYWLNGGTRRPQAPKLNGQVVFPALDIASVASVSVGEKLALAAGEDGWTLKSAHGYPASREKILENLMKLTELKVGQVVRGKQIAKSETLVLKDADGKCLASLDLGEKHAKWGYGRYATFEGATVLLSDALDAFDGEVRSWCETKLATEPYVSFTSVADPALQVGVTGFNTGAVCRVVVASEGTNKVYRAAKLGAKDASGNVYFKFDDEKWIYTIPSYTADSLSKAAR